MAGFFQRRAGPATRGEKVTMWVSLLLTLSILLIAIAERRTGAFWHTYVRLGIAPLGVAELVLALVYWWRARVADPGDRYTPRSLRMLALIFFVLGAVSIALSAYQYSKGA